MVGGTVQCTVQCEAELNRSALTCSCCQLYYAEEAGEEGQTDQRVGRVGGRHTFHEVRDVHVGN